jgi:hypothetical protein
MTPPPAPSRLEDRRAAGLRCRGSLLLPLARQLLLHRVLFGHAGVNGNTTPDRRRGAIAFCWRPFYCGKWLLTSHLLV